ncbi:copper resistance protein B [Sphingomonas sp. UYAg733]
MSRFLIMLAAGTALVLSLPVAAFGQSMPGMDHGSMPGMKMSAPAKKPAAKKPAAKNPTARKAADKKLPARKPAAKTRSVPARAVPAPAHADHGAMPEMDHGSMPGMDMSGDKPASSSSMPGRSSADDRAAQPMDAMPGMAMPEAATPGMPMPGMEMTGTALPAGNAPAPAAPRDHYADRFFPGNDMAWSHSLMMREQGGQNFHQVMFNLAEVQIRDGKDGYRWDGEAWFGGDLNRLTLKSEGEGVFREGVESAEIQALYSRAVGPYFNLQAGVRHDFQPSPTRTYATVGFEGLAPYMFEVEGALFLSDKGDLLGRLEGYYDQRLTQRLILQPRVELNLAAQDVRETRTGSGFSNAELGLRLRYEITRQFAPYVGLSWDRKVGDTARYARFDGHDVEATSLVAGLRFWF